MENNKIFKMEFAKLYPLYIQKAERKDRTKKEVDTIICWLTGYNLEELEKQINSNISLESFFEKAPKINSKISEIKGSICGIKIEEIKDPLMHKIRVLDKLIDELAKGKDMDKILRK